MLLQQASAQGYTPTFNRYQYHKFHWQSFYTKDYTVYFPEGCDSLCKFATDHLPAIIKSVQKETGLATQSPPNIIIYPSLAQLYESNVGLYDSVMATFPTIEIKGGRVLTAFNGSYEQFFIQIKEAWIRACWEEHFSSGVEAQLTGKPPICPEWFKNAFISYMASGWQLNDEAALHQKFLMNKPQSWEAMLSADSILSGKAFCYFLCIRYRGDAALQLLFQFRQKKTLARAARLIFKKDIRRLEKECFVFYQKRYENITGSQAIKTSDDATILLIQKHLKSDEKLINICADKNDKQKIIIVEKANKRTIYIFQDKDSLLQQANKIMTYALPPWLDNHQSDTYPLTVWSKNNRNLFVIAPEKGIITVKEYSSNGAFIRQKKLYGVDGVNDFIEESNNDWILSAYRKGQSDIVDYHPQRERYTPLTDDKADDYLLRYNPETNTYTYRSGLPPDSLGKDSVGKPYGVYSNQGSKEVLLKPDTKREHFISAEQDYSNIYTQWINEQEAIEKTKDSIAKLEQQIKENDINVSGAILGYAGDSGKKNKRSSIKERKRQMQDSLYASPVFNEDKIQPYRLQLFRSWYTARVNNDYFINRLQPYQGYLGTYKFPEVGAMIASGFSDLFGNYHFNIGYKMPAGTEGSDFFIRFENTKRTTDWHLMYYRKVESLQPDAIGDWRDTSGNPYPALAKVKTYYFEAGLYYPFSYNWGLDIMPAFRKGRTVFLSTDKYSLDFNDLKEWWNINTLTLTGHHTHPTIPLLYKGWNVKLLSDIIASYGKDAKFSYGINAQVEYHQPLYKYITLVARAKAGYSGGDEHILYNFGGTDNNIVPRVDTGVHFAQDAPYIFQELIGGLRGYEQNSLYGNAYGMLQADIYFPVFNTLIPLNTGFSSIHNLQLGIFTDMAYAGETWNIADKDWKHKIAYGFSARTLLAGYPIRFDIAWPGSFNKKPVWYLSLTL